MLALLALAALLTGCGAAASGQAPAATPVPSVQAAASGAAPGSTSATTSLGAGGGATPNSASGSAAASVLPAPTFAHGSVSIATNSGTVTLQVEVADTEAKREYGLMNRASLPSDAGMVFVFQPPADSKQVAFWMKDTLIPLSVAFVEPDMKIESIQEMEALSQQLHYAPRAYAYAIEANKGFFTNHGVAVGDSVSVMV